MWYRNKIIKHKKSDSLTDTIEKLTNICYRLDGEPLNTEQQREFNSIKELVTLAKNWVDAIDQGQDKNTDDWKPQPSNQTERWVRRPE